MTTSADQKAGRTSGGGLPPGGDLCEGVCAVGIVWKTVGGYDKMNSYNGGKKDDHIDQKWTRNQSCHRNG